jgi:hypothetical protein
MSGQCQIMLFNYLYFPDLGVLSFANTFLLIQRMSSDVKRETGRGSVLPGRRPSRLAETFPGMGKDGERCERTIDSKDVAVVIMSSFNLKKIY